MGTMQRLNGRFGRQNREELMSKFLQEQGRDLPEATRRQFLAAFEAEVRDNLDAAEKKYKKVLRSVGKSRIVKQRLRDIRRRKGRT